MLGSLLCVSIARTSSISVSFSRSLFPICWGVSLHASIRLVPSEARNALTVVAMMFAPKSVRKYDGARPVKVRTNFRKVKTMVETLVPLLYGMVQVFPEYKSKKRAKY